MSESCPDIVDLERYVLGDLDESAAGKLTDHICGCVDCAAQTSELRANLEMASSIRHGRSGPVPATDAEPATIGPFRVIRKIGQGGMGSVYEAQQDNPRRTVALKIIRAGLISRSLMARFRHEVQILGRLRHPGIAQIYEAGTHQSGHGPQPFFVMELVNGPPLLRYADQRQLGTEARLGLLAGICDAVHHAHQRGVIHRDLKPDNILVDDSAGAPQPKILDFGVARVIDPDAQQTTMHTSAGQIVGTVAYMSPEQASGDGEEIDTRSDVYALGVIGYQLLSGRMPYKLSLAGVAESVRTIVQDEPTPLHSISRSLRGDVTTIIGKALSKEKSRRYPSAAEMAADIRRHLHDEPITAHPPSTIYQLGKFARRNKGLVAGIAAAFVVLIAGVIGTSIGLVRAERARDLAEAARIEADRNAKAAVASAAEAKNEAQRQQAVTDFLRDMLAAASPGSLSSLKKAKGRDITLFAALEEAGRKVNAGSLDEQPHTELAVREIICATYQELGEYDLAAQHAEAALALARRLHSGEHRDIANALNSLAVIRKNQGNYAEARDLGRQALEMYRRIMPDGSDGVSTAMNNFAMMLQEDGRLQEAEALFREVLEIRRKQFGTECREYTVIANNLASLLKDTGRREEAEALYRQALQVNQKLFGEGHPDIAKGKLNLGSMLSQFGQFQEAEQLMSEALALQIKLFGEDHPGRVPILNNLARLAQAQKKYDDAEKLLSQAIEIHRLQAGEDNPIMATLLNNLAALYDARDKFEDAERLFRRIVEMRIRMLGADHPDVASAMHNLGYVLDEQQKYSEAESLFRQALAITVPKLGEDHHTVAASRMHLGKCLTQLGRYDEAERDLLTAMRVHEPDLASRDRAAMSNARYLVNLYRAWDKPDEAAKWQSRLPATRPATTRPSTQTAARPTLTGS